MNYRKWICLAALIPAIAMVFVDQSVLPVALPTIQDQLGATHSQLWWCINSYLLVAAVLMLAGGKLGDVIGHRKTFMWGIFTFAWASALCGLSFHMNFLIGARALQGIGAALMIPASSPLIMSLFSHKDRGKAIGINVSVSSLFLVVAPLIGGYFTEALSWRWIFWINLPLAAIGLILIPILIPATPQKKQSFDFPGFVFFTIGASCFVTLIMQGEEWGWTSASSIIFFISALVSSWFLIQREKRSRHPFIDLSLFKPPIYKAVNISVFATQFVLMISIYRAVFFQDTMEWSPLKSGLVFCVTSLPVLFMSPIGGWIADKSGAKTPVVLGFIFLIGSFFSSAFFVEDALWILLLVFLAFGVGVPLILTPSYSSAMASVPETKAGTAFGVLATVRALSSTLGVAIITAFAKQVQRHTFEKKIEGNPITKGLESSLVENLSIGVQGSLESIPAEQRSFALEYMKESQVRGFFVVHIALGCALIIALGFVFMLYHRKASHRPPEAPAEGWD